MGGKHVRYLLKKYAGDEAKAVAAYNWGEGNLDKALAANDGRDWRAHLPHETYDYLGKVLGAQAAGLPASLHGLPVSPVKVEQVRTVYQNANPQQREALLAQDDTDGRIARAVHEEFQRFDQSQMAHDPALSAMLGGRMEDRALGYRLQGTEPKTALSLAASDVAANLPSQALSSASEGWHPAGFADQAVQSALQGVKNLQATGAGLGAWAADVVGDKDAAARLAEDYQNLDAEAARMPVDATAFRDIHSGGDAAKWAIHAIYSNLPLMFPSLATGGLGGVAARTVAERGFADLAAKWGEEKAAQLVARRVAQGAGAGAAASSIGMEMGGIYGDTRQETGEGHPGLALAAAVPAGLLDTIPDMAVLRKALGAEAAQQVGQGLIQRYGLPAAKQLLTEGSTEGMQTAIERGAAAQAAGRGLTDDDLNQITEAMAQGAVAGGIVAYTCRFFKKVWRDTTLR